MRLPLYGFYPGGLKSTNDPDYQRMQIFVSIMAIAYLLLLLYILIRRSRIAANLFLVLFGLSTMLGIAKFFAVLAGLDRDLH